MFVFQANEVAKPVVSDNESCDDVEDSDQLKPISIEELKGKDIVGGIDIKKMMKKLGKEDKLDRQAERDRVKRKHKENRKKQRKERKIFSEMVNLIIFGLSSFFSNCSSKAISKLTINQFHLHRFYDY